MIEYLINRTQEAGRGITREQAEKIVRYHEILTETNKTLNLTRVPDTVEEAADRNYIDSLMPWIATDRMDGIKSLLDVGAGAGFPGLPLSIVLPETRVILLDSLRKRVDFLNDVIKELGLNAEAVHDRAEEGGHRSALRGHFDVVTARAVAALPVLLELTLPFVRTGGCLLAYHGPKADEEIPMAKKASETLGGGEITCLPMPVPGRDWDHRLVIVPKVNKTPGKYPRKPGEPGRKPII